MKKCLWIALALVAVALLFSCNKQKPVVLDYEKAGTEKIFDQKGLPGESHVGTPPEDAKHRGYEPSSGKDGEKEAKPEPKEKEKNPVEEKPAEKKPAEKKPAEKK
jgi:hypothetical protein